MLLWARHLSLISLRGMRLDAWFLVCCGVGRIVPIVRRICSVSLGLWMLWRLVRVAPLNWVLVMVLDIRYVMRASKPEYTLHYSQDS